MEEAEEIADRDQDDGVKLEPFNLATEREEGFFDESGHYVEHKPDNEDETDAWLGSEDGEQLWYLSCYLSALHHACVVLIQCQVRNGRQRPLSHRD